MKGKVLLLASILFHSFLFAQQKADTLLISKAQAIEIAKQQGYYKTDKGWRVQVEFDTEKGYWLIQTRKDGCSFFHRNVIGHIKDITIDAKTRKVIYKFDGWPRTPPCYY